ncbi:MAG TPA: hypothetical protein VHE55_15250 [Fimbriimonadaceae bacterium]|nr:hypothetical protein [Fimbriimonadaceae bacterium]
MTLRNDHITNGSSGEDGSFDGREIVLKERVEVLNQQLKALKEVTEADFVRRQVTAKEQLKEHRALVEEETQDYESAREWARLEIRRSRENEEAARLSASQRLSETGTQYVPGQTTIFDILKVPPGEDIEFVRKSDLPFGSGVQLKFEFVLKVPLAIGCQVMTSTSLGLATHLISAKNIFANPGGLTISGIVGTLIALGILIGFGALWKLIGTKVGSARPTKEVMWTLSPIAVLTLASMGGLAALDAKAISSMESAATRLNPALATPGSVLALIGLVVSALYVVAVVACGFIDGYNKSARILIDGLKAADVQRRRAAKQEEVAVKAAIQSLSDVDVAERHVEKVVERLEHLELKHKRDSAELRRTTPVVPDKPTAEEQRRIEDLEERLHIAQENLRNHIATRRNRNQEEAS